MVIHAESAGPSLDPVNAALDPVNPYTNPAQKFHFSVDSFGEVFTDIEGRDGSGLTFRASFDMPDPDAPSVPLHEEWILSNDRIYWGNGVYDMLFYNGLLLDADVAEVDVSSVEIHDGTPWAQYVDEKPSQVLVFRNPLQFALHPWYNVEELCAAP